MKQELVVQSSTIEWHNMPWGFLFMTGIVVVLVIVIKNLLK